MLRFMNFQIIEYDSVYRESIRILNEEWLRKYFVVEPSDVVQLGDPESWILGKGGYICFARLRSARPQGQRIVGVGALMPVSDGVVELAKMAVSERFQGKGIGRAIVLHCLVTARKMGGSRIVLYTNSRLLSAIHLYEDFGFEYVDLKKAPYQRADRKMELSLINEVQGE